jgi:TolA-binding protein
MNNKELMKVLSQVSKNDKKGKQILVVSLLAVAGFAGCAFLYSKYKRFKKDNKSARENYLILNNMMNTEINNRENIIRQKSEQLNKLQNKINQLITNQENKPDNYNPVIPTV